mmetsp:Transcript_12151/g.35940  ORF Transcript_12151/g.35940 Transcript_12151/m.35940 type:complete len:106 (+) Transcript_12151:1917-2234(+)
MICAMFPDFLEALARVTLFKAMPTDTEIEDYGCSETGEYFDRLVKEGALKGWNASHKVDWQVEQEEGREIEDTLDKFLNLVVHRLDLDMSGKVDKKDWHIASGHN